MRTSRRHRGVSTLEVLLALTTFGVAMAGILTLQWATVRASTQAAHQRYLAQAAAQVADSLGSLRCTAGSGALSVAAGTLSWRARHHTAIATVDLLVAPHRGPMWQVEVTGPC